MKPAVVLLNFGEPERPEPDEMLAYLERIFSANRRLREGDDPGEADRRARRLAERRVSGLLEEHARIGGSPLLRQTRAQADGLAAELARRGRNVVVVTGMQFTPPSIEHAVRKAGSEGADRIVGLPLYPLCGPSTTVPALAELRREAGRARWREPVAEVPGWHRHPAYAPLWADAIRRLCLERGLDLADRRVRVVFSAHGTPRRYLRAGSRYELYARDHVRAVAEALGGVEYALGFQNHESRPGTEWTEPEIGAVVRSTDAAHVVVVPVSFMQEQSETLWDLDHELRRESEAAGLEFHRVPIPYDDPRFHALLADLVEPFVGGVQVVPLDACRCRPAPGAVCLNAGLGPPPATGPGAPPPSGDR